MKNKTTYVLMLCICIVLSMLSSCKSEVQTAIVGKWYDSSGECLDIHSDGTYKLENDYGTGTWKILEDNETIEFKDFYGSTTEVKIETDEKGNYINLGNAGIFYNIKDIQNKKQSANGIAVVKTAISPFSEGIALIKYEELSGKKYAAMIDTKGNILYKLENGHIEQDLYNRLNYVGSYSYIGFDGISYIKDTSYHIISKNGKVVANSGDMGFDEALALGEGMVLVYKDNSNINGNQYCYGIIDSKGNWQTSLVDIPFYPNCAHYAGSGIFKISAKKGEGGYTEHATILFNAFTGKFDIMSNDYGFEFIDNVAYYKDSNSNECICINTDFEKEKVASCDYFTGGYSIIKGEYLTITNCSTGKSVKLTEFKSDQISAITFKNNCGLVELHGKDGNPYFTVIDSNGVIQFEPVKGWAYDWNDEVISYKDGDNGRCAMKTNGETLFSNSDYLTYGYSNGIFTARDHNDDDVWFYVNDKGEKILETLYD